MGAIAVLGDGWVRLVSASPSGKELQATLDRYRKLPTDPAILEMTRVTLEMKLPVLVLVGIGRMKYVLHPQESLRDAWKADEADVSGKDLEVSREIAASIGMTIDAGLANQDLYIQDGCNGWVAKATLPVSVYAVAMVYGTLAEWLEFCCSPGAPKPVKAYQDTVDGIIRAEYPQWDRCLRRTR